MTSSSIAIHNIYVMMAYAFRAIRSGGISQVEAEEFDHLHDLFAEILLRGVGALVKRGLHRDYVPHSDELGTVRGRLDITRTVATRSTLRGKLVCEFDEYEPDTPHNQAIKAVIVLLIRHGQVSASRRDALRRLLPYLDAVTLIAPDSIRWNTLTYHRSNANYRFLLGACELVVRGLLPTTAAGSTKLTSWISDEAMSSLYERFLREYYAIEHPEISTSSPRVPWDCSAEDILGNPQLPAMYTDVVLRKGHRTLIIDAKYYGHSMQQGRWGKSTLHSAHIYQIFAYVKNTDIHHDGSTSGLILYARTNAIEQPDVDVTIQGNRIGAKTLDLNQEWPRLREQLEELLSWLAD